MGQGLQSSEVRAGWRRRRASRIRFLYSVVPVRLPLTGDAGEDRGEVLHLPEWQEQPPGDPAALQIRWVGSWPAKGFLGCGVKVDKAH